MHVEWDPNAAVTPLGPLPFFIEFRKISDLFDPWAEACPLGFASPNAPPGPRSLAIVVSRWANSTKRSFMLMKRRVVTLTKKNARWPAIN